MKTKLTLALFVALTTLLMLPTTVAAQVQNCVNPGPYGVCPPDTDIVIGNISIDDRLLTFLIAGLVFGLVLMLNGTVILHKVRSVSR